MILSKHEENNTIECLYDSTNILASKYLPDEKKLAIIFKSGTQYVYFDVKNEDYRKFEISKSQGKVMNSVIKKYSYTKSTDIVDVSPIMEQIKNLKNE